MDNNSNKSSKPKTRFKDLIKELGLYPNNSNQEGVSKSISSESDLSMIRFLLNKRNQFTR